jgi:hypothetical protein
MSTADRKCGANVKLWVTFLNFEKIQWFTQMASIIENGKLARRLYILIVRVFLRMTEKVGAIKSRSKLYKPTHGLLNTPNRGVKRLNAINTPYIGP